MSLASRAHALLCHLYSIALRRQRIAEAIQFCGLSEPRMERLEGRMLLAGDPGGTLATAAVLGTHGDQIDLSGSGATFSDAISPGNDVDMFRFYAHAGDTVRFNVTAPGGISIRLLDAIGFLQTGTSTIMSSAYVSRTFAATGTYYIGLSAYDNSGYSPWDGSNSVVGHTTSYSLSVSASTATVLSAQNLGTNTSNAWTLDPKAGSPTDYLTADIRTGMPDYQVYRVNVNAADEGFYQFYVPGTNGFQPKVRLFDGNGVEKTSSANPYNYYPYYLTQGVYYVGISGAGNDAYSIVPGAADTSTPGSTGGEYSIWVEKTTGTLPNIPDANLRQAIMDQLAADGHTPFSILTNYDISRLTALDASNRGISDLTGLDAAWTIQDLDISGNQITDLSPITGILGYTLNVAGNPLGDAGLTNSVLPKYVENLNISSTGITSLSALAGRTKLHSLNASGNALTTLSALTNLDLRSVDLSNCGLDDATFASADWSTSTYLDSLDIHGNLLTNLTPLAGNMYLANLDAHGNALTDISGLSALLFMRSVDLSDNQINSLAPLESWWSSGWHYAMNSLDVSGNPINTNPGTADRAIIDTLVNYGVTVKWDPYVVDVTINDPNLEQAIRQQLTNDGNGIDPSTPLTVDDMQGLTTLNASGMGITDLSGLEYATNLSSLDISGNPIGDAGLSTIAQLKTLTYLSLANCGITSLAALAPTDPADPSTGMPNLRTLVLGQNWSLSDYSAVATMPMLSSLDMSFCGISDTAPLNGLTGLTSLNLFMGYVSTLADISTLTGLRELNIRDNQLTDLTGLDQLVNLTSLELGTNPLGQTAISAVDWSVFGSLQSLGLFNTGLTDLTFLAPSGTPVLPMLNTLDVQSNSLTNLHGLEGYNSLARLYATYNQIADISAITGLSGISYLSLNHNQISDLSPLSGLTNIDVCDLANNKITSLSAAQWSTMPTLHTLWVNDNAITDLTPVGGISTIWNLDVSDNTVSVLTPLAGMSGLVVCNLANNHIRTLTSVPDWSVFPLLQQLYLSHNGINTDPASADGQIISSLTGRGIYVDVSSQDYVSLFADSNLEAAIRQRLIYDGYTPGPTLTQADLLNLYILSAQWDNITSLEGLQYATNLSRLNLSYNSITDLSPLAGLRLSQLDVSYNSKLTDVSPLSGMASLTDLFIGGTGVSSVAPLAGLTSLQELDIDSTSIGDISPLVGLSSLRFFNLDNTPVADVSVLSGMTSLSYLYLGSTNVSDLAALAGLSSLKNLDLDTTPVTDLTPLSGLTNLSWLDLAHMSPGSLAPLHSLSSLGALDLSYCNISNAKLATLDWPQLSSLKAVNLDGNPISDLSPISGATSLNTLSVNYSDLSTLGAIASLTALTQFDAWNSQISDISGLSGLYSLKYLNVDNNQITSIAPLAGLTAMVNLDIAGNQIADVSPISGMTQLSWLNAGYNQITTLTDVNWANLPNLMQGSFVFDRLASWPEGVDAPILAMLYARGFYPNEAQTVIFSDANVEAAVRAATYTPAGQVVNSVNMANMTTLNLSGKLVTSIQGIEYATGLKTLDLRHTRVNLAAGSPDRARVDLLIARGVTVMVDAVLIADPNLDAAIRQQLINDGDGIDPLAELTAADLLNLTTLDASNRGITDLTGLDGATSLWRLDVTGNSGLSDLAPISGMTSLSTLDISGTAVTDLSTVSSLSNLYNLQLNNTHPSSLSPLAGLTQLVFLGLENCQVTDAMLTSIDWSALNVVVLNLGSNQLTTLAPLAALKSLGDLSIHYNGISSLAPLSGLKLTNLEARSNQISDLSPLSAMTSLTSLYLYNNLITDISPLAGLTSMGRLYIGGNQITDLSPIQGMSGLTVLDANSNQIRSISNVDFTRLPQLQWGGVSNNYLNVWPESPDGIALRMLWNRAGGFVGLRGQQVTFADPNFELAIRTALVRPVGPCPIIYNNDMDDAVRLNSLDLSGVQITSIQGIENALSLTFLDLRHTGLNLAPGTPDRARVELLISRGVTVLFNTRPAVYFGGDASLNEGSTYTGSGSFVDPDADSWTATVDYGDGTIESLTFDASHAFSLSHRYDDNGTYSIKVTVDDGTDSGSLAEGVTVNEVAPTATLASTGAVIEGTSATVRFTNQYDPSNADTAAGFTYAYDLNDDGVFETSGGSSLVIPGSMLPNGPATKTIRGRIIDKDGAHTDYPLVLVIQNARPTPLPSVRQVQANAGSPAAFTGTISDPGLTDTWTSLINFGDGSPVSSLTIVGRSYSASHTYATPGTYVASIVIIDNDGGTGLLRQTVIVGRSNAAVSSIVVNDGAAQRSMVTSMTCTFTSAVVVESGAFVLQRSDGQIIATSASTTDGKTYRITFSGTGTERTGSLSDGRYTLTVNTAHVKVGGLPITGANASFALWRLFGDVDGDGDCDALDFVAFRKALNHSSPDPAYSALFDIDGNGTVDAADLTAFRARYGTKI